MVGSRFGVWGACATFVVSWSPLARAQSTASFPAPSSSAPPAPMPVAPAAPAPAVPPKPAAPAPAASTDSTTDSRYPVLPSAPAPSALPAPSANLNFYPALLPYRDGLPVPPGYRVEHRAASGLIAGGLVTLIVSYGAGIAVGVGDHFNDGTGWTVVPVIGPWAAIGARSFHCDNDPLKANQCVKDAFSEVQTIAILSADAVVQATGAVLFFAGLGSGRDELVRSDLETGVRVTPRAVGTSGFGVGLDGRF
ncbi:MAG TPA: hypothetical protein VGM44_02130 [Polyangiaceae bacterium]